MSKFGFNKAIMKLETIKTQLPKVIANDAVGFWLKGFREEGFTDKTFKAWKPRKGTQTGRNATRKILVDSGKLRRSVSNSVKTATWQMIHFKVEVPYAKYVQEGTDKMEARKFMGDSFQLRKQLTAKINLVIRKIWQI